jgi:hypothetical protein
MSVNIQKSYSALNEKIFKFFDQRGVRRAFTVPYIDGQDMNEHVQAVGQAAQQTGGLTSNLLVTAHHSDGKGWGSGDGHTVGYSSELLRHSIIPKNDEDAKAVISAAQKHLDGIEELLGKDDPTVKTANSQLDLVKKQDGAGMNLLDFGVLMTQIMYRPNQAVAREHSGAKQGGHSPALRSPGAAAPSEESDESEQAPDGQEPEETATADNAGAPGGQTQPEQAPAAPAGAQAAPAQA